MQGESRSFYSDFIETVNSQSKKRINKFIMKCMMILRKHQNMQVFALERVSCREALILKGANEEELQMHEQQLQLQIDHRDLTDRFVESVLRELRLSQKSDQALNLFLSKRLWQLVQLSDNYCSSIAELIEVRSESQEQRKERAKKLDRLLSYRDVGKVRTFDERNLNI